MKHCHRLVLAATFLGMMPDFVTAEAIPAFSGAEGAGAFATGGRPKLIQGVTQGEVYHVTNLAPDPTGSIYGSLRYGMNDGNFRVLAIPGVPVISDVPATFDIKPRIIVFDVGGTIVLDNTASNSDIDITPRNFTLAGQTAPGGITIYGAEFNPGHRDTWDSDGSPSPTNNLIIRNLAVRTHNANEKDGFWVPLSNSIVDHVSTSWYTDEGVSITDGARNITLQHSIIGPGWHSPDGDGSQIEGKTPMADISVHHNLYIHNDARNPRTGEKEGPGVELDFRNNVVFNWNDSKAGYSGANEPSFNNFVNNYYIGGPGNSSGDNIFSSGGAVTRIYQSGNLLDLDRDGTADGIDYGWSKFAGAETQVNVPYSVPHNVTQTPAEALATIQQYAGARWWSRDFLDDRSIAQLVTLGQGTVAQTGQVLNTIPASDISLVANAPLQSRSDEYDSDKDGMEDSWEIRHGLNPHSTASNPDWLLDYDGDGYINVEEFINEIAEWPAPYEIVFTGGTNSRYEQITNWSITRPSPGEADTTTHWQPSRFDVAVINSTEVTVDSVGQHAGSVRVGAVAGGSASLTITGGWLVVEDESYGLGTGEVTIGAHPTADAQLNLTGGKLAVQTLSKGAGGSFNFTGGALNAGVVNFDLTNNGGSITPGDGVGTTVINGDLLMNSGSIAIDLASPISYDILAVTGGVVLGGNLVVDLLNGFKPDNSHEFTVLTSNAIAGTFTNLYPGNRVKVLDGTGSFLVTAGGDRIILSNFIPEPPLLAGDFNGDGVVDAADYVVWRQAWGSTKPLLNETASPGVIDEQDLIAWRSNFGATSLENGTGLNIPEPLSSSFAAVALIVASLHRERRELRHRNSILS